MVKKEKTIYQNERNYRDMDEKKYKIKKERKINDEIYIKERGSFGIDKPKRIVSMRKIKHDPLILKCEIEWKRRENGFKPKNREYTHEIIKKYEPLLLINYYEDHLIFPKRKDNYKHKG